jgi:hypothetical protein
MHPENEVPLIFKWMEANFNHIVFDFASVTNVIRQGAYSENSVWYTCTVKVEMAVLPYVR